MSEKLFKVERIKHNDYTYEYRVRVASTHVVDIRMDDVVPSRYIAAYVVNALREFVNSSTLDEDVLIEIDRMKANDEVYCQCCGQKVMKQ